MNFGLASPADCNYNKIMMQKHLDQKRQRRYNMTQSSLNSPLYPSKLQNSRMSAVQSLPLAGQTLLNYSTIGNLGNNSSLVMPAHKKQVNEQNEKMKKMLRSQLDESLTDQMQRRKQNQEENKKLQKSMSTENGMLDYLEKEIEKRDNFIKMCIVKQEIRKNSFVDEAMRKHRNALNLIEQNYDVDVFNHESDRYQQAQKINFQRVLETNGFQVQHNQISRQLQKSQYGRYLDEKYVKEKHNPITNPMEYHIENPYVRKQLQKY